MTDWYMVQYFILFSLMTFSISHEAALATYVLTCAILHSQ
jgi:hypothetical protein